MPLAYLLYGQCWFLLQLKHEGLLLQLRMKKNIFSIKNPEIYSKIASGAFWSILGMSISKLLVLIAGIVCANVLGSKDYGQLGIIRSTINMFVIFGTAGMGVTATKYISQYCKSNVEKVGTIFAISNIFTFISGFVISLFVIIFSSGISDYLNAPELCISIRFGGFLLFFSIVNGCYNGSMIGYEKFKILAINTFVSSLIEAVFVVSGAYYGGVSGALVGYGLGIMSLTVFNRCSVHKLFKASGVKINYSNLHIGDFKVLYQFSLPAALSSFIVVPSYWAARALLANHSGFEEVGMYEVAEQWRTIILFIPSALSNIILPMLSGFQTSNDRNSYKKAFYINLLLNVVVSTLVASVVILFSSLILGAYGQEFDNRLTFIILACSTIFSSFSSVVGVTIVSKGKAWQGMCFNMVWALNFIGLTFLFINNDMGSSGISLACLIAYFLHSIYQFIYLLVVKNE